MLGSALGQVDSECACAGAESSAPIQLEVVQKAGKVQFKFWDRSTCEDGFNIVRYSPTNEQTAVAASFKYESIDAVDCPPGPYTPQQALQDDMRDLQIGKTYRYCVKAVGNIPTVVGWKPFASSSTCTTLDAVWESSIRACVAMSQDVSGMPVEFVGVKAVAKLKDTVVTKYATTGKDGCADIYFKLDMEHSSQLDPREPYQVSISYEKSEKISSSDQEEKLVAHQFLCNDGLRPCTEGEGSDTVMVKHLDFGISHKAQDTTVRPLSGRIVVADVNPDDPYASPLNGVEVCIERFSTSQRAMDGSGLSRVCSKTNQRGEFVLNAVPGMLITLDILYSDHEFEPIGQAAQNMVKNGLLVEAPEGYKNLDFKDVTKNTVTVQVAAGECNGVLGVSSLAARVNKVAYTFAPLKVSSNEMSFRLPAHHVELQVSEIQRGSSRLPPQQINKIESLQIDLRTANQTARFVHKGSVKYSVDFVGNQVRKYCSPSAKDLILDSLQEFTLQVHAWVDFGIDGVETCNRLSADHTMVIRNRFGLQPLQDTDDAEILKTMQAHGDERTIQAMMRCYPSCELVIPANKTAFISVQMMAGYPSIVKPFRKSMKFYMAKQELVVDGIVVGKRARSGAESVSIPEAKPIMVLRDPPGSKSYSSYERVSSTVEVQIDGHTAHSGYDTKSKTGGGVSVSVDVTVGGGIGAFTGLETTSADTEFTAGVSHKHGEVHTKEFVHNESTAKFTTTWSYATSQDMLGSGAIADVFVIPTLEVVFTTSDEVSMVGKTCQAQVQALNTFSLDSPENSPGLAFLSRLVLKYTFIPNLERDIKLAEEEPVKSDAVKAKIEAMKSALEHWNQVLEDDRKLLERAKNGELHSSLRNWANDQNLEVNVSGSIGVVPQGLQYNATKVTDDATNLTDYEHITFHGGGGDVSLTLDLNKHHETVKSRGAWGNRHVHTVNGGGIKTKIQVLVAVVNSEVSGAHDYDFKTEAFRNSQQDTGTQIKVILGDQDVGDRFMLKILYDPVYKSFLFVTIGGESRCPIEEGTTAREKISMSVTPFTKPVLDGETMTFEIRATNQGTVASGFNFVADYRDNPTGVGLRVANGYAGGNYVRNVEAGETVRFFVKLTRGPIEYVNPAVRVLTYSKCEMSGYPAKSIAPSFGDMIISILAKEGRSTRTSVLLSNTPDGKVAWVQKCPPIHIVGSHEVIRINFANKDALIPITVRSPLTPIHGSLAKMKSSNNSRLEKVVLQYINSMDRAQSTWKDGKDKDGKVLDLTSARIAENEYGYSTVQWNTKDLQDGTYKIRVATFCDTIQGAPEEFSEFSSDKITVHVDRTPPKLARAPALYMDSNQPIRLQFQELLSCNNTLDMVELFVQRDGSSVQVDTKDLVTVCERDTLVISFRQGFPMESVYGFDSKLVVRNVQDVVGNVMLGSAEYSLVFTGQGVQLEGKVNVFKLALPDEQFDCEHFKRNKTAIQDMVLAGTPLRYSSDQIDISDTKCVQCSAEDTAALCISGKVEFSSNLNGGRSLLETSSLFQVLPTLENPETCRLNEDLVDASGGVAVLALFCLFLILLRKKK